MPAVDSGYLPHQNPCAQCGRPIAAPDWFEERQQSTAYLWRCDVCDYTFESVAVFDDGQRQIERRAG